MACVLCRGDKKKKGPYIDWSSEQVLSSAACQYPVAHVRILTKSATLDIEFRQTILKNRSTRGRQYLWARGGGCGMNPAVLISCSRAALQIKSSSLSLFEGGGIAHSFHPPCARRIRHMLMMNISGSGTFCLRFSCYRIPPPLLNVSEPARQPLCNYHESVQEIIIHHNQEHVRKQVKEQNSCD